MNKKTFEEINEELEEYALLEELDEVELMKVEGVDEYCLKCNHIMLPVVEGNIYSPKYCSPCFIKELDGDRGDEFADSI